MLTGHHVVGAPKSLAGDQGDERHGGLRIGEQQLGAVLDEAAVFLRGAGQEAGHVHEGDDRDFEGVAEAHEAGSLARRVGVEHAGQHERLVGHDPHGAALDAAEARHDVGREPGLDLKEVALVQHLEDEFLDVVGLVGVLGHQRVEGSVLALGIVEGGYLGSARLVVGGQEVEQAPHLQERLHVVVPGAVCHRRPRRVDARAAQVLGRDGLVGDGLHDLGAGHEHVARVPHHEDEVRHGGRIHVAARAGTHDDRDLRNHARRDRVAAEHLAVAPQRRHALLDAGAAGIEQADDGRPHPERHVLDLGDLARVGLAERAAEHGEVLGEDEDGAAVHRAPARHHAVARHLAVRHAEVGRTVLDELAELLERSLVEQQVDALAGGQLAARVLGLDANRAPARFRPGPARRELLDHTSHPATLPGMSGRPAPRRRANAPSALVPARPKPHANAGLRDTVTIGTTGMGRGSAKDPSRVDAVHSAALCAFTP